MESENYIRVEIEDKVYYIERSKFDIFTFHNYLIPEFNLRK